MSRLPAVGESVKAEVLTERIKLLLGEGTPAMVTPFCQARVTASGEDRVTLDFAEQVPNLRPGTPLILHYHDEGGIYLLLAKVVESEGSGRVTVSVKGLEEHQRRRDTRKKVAIPARYRLQREGELALSLYEWQNSATVDISRGGVLLRVDESIQPGDNLELELDLGSGMVKAEGRVTRVESEKTSGVPLAGIRFTNIRPQEQEAIRWFVLSQ